MTFEPDVDRSINQLNVLVAIIDDNINEATEQVFIVELGLVDSVNPSSIVLTRRASLCRIIDDDGKNSKFYFTSPFQVLPYICCFVLFICLFLFMGMNLRTRLAILMPISLYSGIEIGFEFPTYTYTEPTFDESIDENFIPKSGLPINGPIYLAKENDRLTEQTFQLYVHFSSSVPPVNKTNIQPATRNEDYSSNGELNNVVLQFRPEQQRINVAFSLFPDDVPEGTEAFLIGTSSDKTAQLADGRMVDVPTFLNPTTLSAESFVIIEGS